MKGKGKKKQEKAKREGWTRAWVPWMMMAVIAAFILGSSLFPQAAVSETERTSQTAVNPGPHALSAEIQEPSGVPDPETGQSDGTGGKTATEGENLKEGDSEDGSGEMEVNAEGAEGNGIPGTAILTSGDNIPWKVTSLDIWKDVDEVIPSAYEISLSKTADVTSLEMEVGDEEQVTFTIQVGIQGNPNTFHIEGNIFVKNTGNWPADVTSVQDTVWYKAGGPNWLPVVSSITTTVPTGNAAIPTGGPHVYSYSGTFTLPVSLAQVTSLSNLIEITISNKPDPPPPGMKSHTFHYRKDFPKPTGGIPDNPVLLDEESITPDTGLDYEILSTTINGVPTSDLDGPWELNPQYAPYTVEIIKKLAAQNPGNYTLLNKAKVGEMEDPAQVEIAVIEGEPECGGIEGFKYEDVDGDGQLSEGDAPWKDVTIQLWGFESGDSMDDAEPLAETTTDESGHFSFSCLIPGIYLVKEILPEGTEPVGELTREVEVKAGQVAYIDPPFLNRTLKEEKGEIEGWKYLDANGDGTVDEGEEGLAGVIVRLFRLVAEDTLGDSGLDSFSSPTQVAETTTGEDGSFSFNDLEPGSYMLVEEVSEDYYPTSSPSLEVILEGSDTVQVIFLNAPKPSLSGEKMEYPGYEPVEGVTFTLTRVELEEGFAVSADTWTETRVSGSDGAFDFGRLMPGRYLLEEKVPEGWEPVTEPEMEIELGSGEDLHLTFINRRIPVGSSIYGFKWLDANGDGLHQAAEEPLQGVIITVEGPEGYTANTSTDENGFYAFEGLASGDYSISETVPAGYYPTYPAEAQVTLEEGTSERVDFLNAPYGQIWGLKWDDLNGNGTADAGEGNIKDVTIRLIDSENKIIAVTETLADGSYSFPELKAGIYTVEEMVPYGYENTAATSRTLELAPGMIERVDFFNRVPVAGEVITPPVPGPPSVTPPPQPPPQVAGQTLPITGTELALLLLGAGLLVLLGLGLVFVGAAKAKS